MFLRVVAVKLWLGIFYNVSLPPIIILIFKKCKTMKININNKPTDTTATTLGELAQQMALPEKGVAMALGARMVQRAQWAETALSEGDSVIIIKAACGG